MKLEKTTKILPRCRDCGTIDAKKFSGGGVTYCDPCVMKVAKPLNWKMISTPIGEVSQSAYSAYCENCKVMKDEYNGRCVQCGAWINAKTQTFK